jgi:capsular polysaccharide biosynthesis protein
VILGLLLGLALGYLALPKILGSGSTYQATIRMDVRQAPADTIQTVPPAIGAGGGEGGTLGASPDVLKDYEVAENVVKQLRVQDKLPPTTLLNLLTFTPLQGTSLVDLSFTHGDPRLAASIVKSYATQFADKRNTAAEERFTSLIKQLEAYATELDKSQSPASGGASPSAEVRAQIAKARVARFFTPRPTDVIGQPVVITNGPPLSRNITLAIGLLLGLGIGAGAALLVETAFRKVITPADAEEASDLPFVADVRKAGIRRRTPLPVVDRPFTPAAEDYRRVGTLLERQGLGSDIRVLAIVSADPGDGKSLLAANLAHSWPARDARWCWSPATCAAPRWRSCSGSASTPAWPRPSRTSRSRRSRCWCPSTTTCSSCPPACPASTPASCWRPSGCTRPSRRCARSASSSSTRPRRGCRPTPSPCPASPTPPCWWPGPG